MFARFLGGSTAKEFGVQMAMLLVKRAEMEAGKKDTRKQPSRKTEKRFDATLYSIEKQLVEFILNNRLNVYSKAQLGSAFRFTLLENGFDQEAAKAMTTWLLLRCK